MEGHRIPTWTIKWWTFKEAAVRYIHYAVYSSFNRDPTRPVSLTKSAQTPPTPADRVVKPQPKANPRPNPTNIAITNANPDPPSPADRVVPILALGRSTLWAGFVSDIGRVGSGWPWVVVWRKIPRVVNRRRPVVVPSTFIQERLIV